MVGGAALGGLGVFFAWVGLDAAGQWSDAIGVFVGLIGLAVSVYGVVLARQAVTRPGPRGPVGAGGGVRQRVDAGRDSFTAGRDQHFGGAAGGGSTPPPAGEVAQEVRAGRDGFTAGGDQHFGQRRPR